MSGAESAEATTTESAPVTRAAPSAMGMARASTAAIGRARSASEVCAPLGPTADLLYRLDFQRACRTSPPATQPPLRILLDGARASSCRTRADSKLGGSGVEIRLAGEHGRQRDRHSLRRRNARGARQHLVQHDAERQDVGSARSTVRLRLLRATCRPRCRESTPHVAIAGVVIVGDCVSFARTGSSRLHRLRQPEVEHLHRAVGVTLMFAGFRSRWMMPFSCAASSASAIWRAIGKRLVERNRPARDPLGERRPSTSSMHERVDAVRLLRDRRCAAMLG